MDNAISMTFSMGFSALIFQARRFIHDAEYEVIQRIHRSLGDALYLLNYLVSRACCATSPLDLERQNYFYSLITELRSL